MITNKIKRPPSAKQAAKRSVKKMAAKANPLDDLVSYTDDVEKNSIDELDVVAKGPSACGVMIDGQRKAIELNNDTEFWCAIVFNTREQKEAVLKLLGLFEHGDKYIFAEDFCKALGVNLPPSDFVPKKPKHDKTWGEFR